MPQWQKGTWDEKYSWNYLGSTFCHDPAICATIHLAQNTSPLFPASSHLWPLFFSLRSLRYYLLALSTFPVYKHSSLAKSQSHFSSEFCTILCLQSYATELGYFVIESHCSELLRDLMMEAMVEALRLFKHSFIHWFPSALQRLLEIKRLNHVSHRSQETKDWWTRETKNNNFWVYSFTC